MTSEIVSFGKFILAGEHAVLRGVPALVFPVRAKYMKLTHTKNDAPLSVEFLGTYGEEVHLAFWTVIEEALKKVNKSRNDLTGRLIVESEIPLGAGLGASACLCVSVAKLFLTLGWLEDKELYDFSKSLEDLFHGQSSGVDVAVALDGGT